MESYVAALVLVLGLWFLFGFVYINYLQRKIDRRCDDLRRELLEDESDE